MKPKVQALDRKMLAARRFWLARLETPPEEIELPGRGPRTGTRAPRSAVAALAVAPELYRGLRRLTGEDTFLLGVALTAALEVSLFRSTGKRRFAVGSPALAEGGAQVGANALAVPSEVDPGLTFRDFLLRVRESLLAVHQHQHYPYERLLHDLELDGVGDRCPLFDVSLALTGLHGELPEVGHDLAVVFELEAERLHGRMEYRPNLYPETVVRRLGARLLNLLAAGVAHPEQRLCELSMLSRAESHLLSVEWCGAPPEAPAVCFHDLYEEQAGRSPEALALVFPGGCLSYAELDSRAERIARRLLSMGLGVEDRVGLFTGRAPETVLGILGILKAGAAFVPLDPAHPEDRLRFMMTDAGLSALLTLERLAAQLPPLEIPTLSLDAGRAESADPLRESPAPAVPVEPRNAAYVIYTSGSTGRPKGVLIEHRGMTNAARAEIERLALAPGNRVLQFFTWSFDASIYELNMTLLAGATLFMAPEEHLLGPELVARVREWSIDVLSVPPSVLATLEESELPELGTLTVLGEASPQDLVARWARPAGTRRRRRIFNAYGPTEASMWVVGTFLDGRRRPPIGRPIPGTRVYVLGARLEPLPPGLAGELVVGGRSLGRFYVDRPALTAERFIPEPLGEKPGERLYRTGDLARYLDDGQIDYLGRFDHQVKIRGFRVEPGEVEAVLRRHPAVREAVVVVRDFSASAVPDRRLVAFLVAEPSGKPAVRELREHVRAVQPEFMVPSVFFFLDALPLTLSGKLDRDALPRIESLETEDPEVHLAPRNELERRIAEVWSRELQVARVGIHDNFFDLGGNSLLLVRVAAGLSEVLGRQVSVTEMFQNSTVAKLAEHLGDEAPQDAVSEDAVSEDAVTAVSRAPSRATGSEIAVIGLAGRFPGAADVEEFWRNLAGGTESISRLSDEELLAAGVSVDTLADPRFVRAEGVLEGIGDFDAEFFGMTPKEARVMDPQHRLFLETAWHALESAGYDPGHTPAAVGVYAGSGLNTYLLANLLSNRDLLGSDLGAVLLNDKDYLPTRVSYKLGLEGPSVSVQTACSTSLVAVHLACQALLTRECGLALAGGVSLKVPQKTGYLYQPGGIASPDGHCRAFDARACGTVRGSGVGVVVLKRLDEARADRDTIRAVIRGSAIDNDGAARVGFTAPSVEGQQRVIRQTHAAAAVAPETISYVETHGTGTELGDPVEFAALAAAFRDRHAGERTCALGSVKTNVGHLDAAAGVAGLIKTVLMLERGQIPASLHFERPNPGIDFAGTPFYVNSSLKAWRRRGGPRRAGVSSFGLGGTNAHAVLEEAPPAEIPGESRPWQLLVLSARDAGALDASTRRMAEYLEDDGAADLADVCHTLRMGRRPMAHRQVAVVRDAESAARLLARGEGEGLFQGVAPEQARPVVFYLPERVTGGRELYRLEPALRRRVERLGAALVPYLGPHLIPRLGFSDGAAAAADHEEAERLGRLRLLILELALADLWRTWGVRPAALIGSGAGEYAAACLAGVLEPEDALLRLADVAGAGQAAPMAPRIPLLSCSTGTWMRDEEATAPERWSAGGRGIERLAPKDLRPGWRQSLAHQDPLLLILGTQDATDEATARQMAAELETTILASLPPSESGGELPALLATLGRLWIAGAEVDWEGFRGGERRRRVPLPTYPFQRRRHWIDRHRTATPATAGKRPEVADWFYAPVWRRVPRPPEPSRGRSAAQDSEATAPWLLLCDPDGLGQAVARALRDRGERVATVLAGERFEDLGEGAYLVDPRSLRDYETLVAALERKGLSPETVIHLWHAGRDPHEDADRYELFERAREAGFSCLVHLLRAFGGGSGLRRIQVVGSGLHRVLPGDRLQPEKATIFGPLKVIPQEYPAITCRVCDVELPVASGDAAEALAHRVLAELDAPASELTVAWRGDERWVERFAPLALESPPGRPDWLRPEGVYLILGGFGRLGLELAGLLAREASARLVLTSRSALPDRDARDAHLSEHGAEEATSRRLLAIRELEEHGAEVLALRADVGDPGAMRRAVDLAFEHFGSLDGVIHAAGNVGRDVLKPIADTGPEDWQRHFHLKVRGLIALDEALGDRRPDFCLLLSSLSTVLGGLGFAAYSAAHHFLDAVAQDRQDGPTRWLSVAWDGAARDMEEVEPGAGRHPKSTEAFRRLLSGEAGARVVVSVRDLDTALGQWIHRAPASSGPRPAKTEEKTVPHSTGASAAGRLENQLASIWGRVLGIDEVGLDENFFELGGTSLCALELADEIHDELGRTVTPVDIFEAPTVKAMVRHLEAPAKEDRQEDAEQDAAPTAAQRAPAGRAEVAVVAMAGRFPGADGVEQFWRNLCDGTESITFFSDQELLAAGVDPATLRHPNYVKARPVLEGVEEFDAAFFGFTPREAELMDPQQRLFMECCWQALEKAGYDPRRYPEEIGVFAGTGMSSYSFQLFRAPETALSLGNLQLLVGNSPDTLCSGVSYRLDLRGPSFTVQSHCSTSLVAVHLACQSLIAGECRMALAGGVSVKVPQRSGYFFQEGGQDSPDGHNRSFDARARGTVFGSGLGVVVLKRLEDALADGDVVHAVVKGSAVNNDGSVKAGFTAPSVEGQAAVVRRALALAGVDAASLGYVEAHGSATPLGDPIEVIALAKAFRETPAGEAAAEGQDRGNETGYCALGSVKSNVGHLDRAAGVAGLIKATLCLEHGVIPPSLHFETPNPELDLPSTPFVVNTALRPWQRRNGTPRRASVNSLGLGGTNCHVVLEEAPERPPSGPSRPWQMLPLSARSPTALAAMAANLADAFRVDPDLHLGDAAHTLQVGRRIFDHRRYVLCRDLREAAEKLAQAPPARQIAERRTSSATPQVALLFPGIGDHYLGMAAGLYRQEPAFRRVVDECAELLGPHVDFDLVALLKTGEEGASAPGGETAAPAPESGGFLDLRRLYARLRDEPSKATAELRDGRLAQPFLFVVEYALARLLMEWGIRPAALLGYSLGEYVAATVAEVFPLADALRLVALRARWIHDLPEGAMIAVTWPAEEVLGLLHGSLALAAVASPGLSVVSGPPGEVARLGESLTRKDVSFLRLETRHAYHSQIMKPVAASLAAALRSVELRPPRIPCVSNLTGTWMNDQEATDPEYWARHLSSTVRFTDCVATLLEDDERVFVEVGPGHSLGTLVAQCAGGARKSASEVVTCLRHSFETVDDQALLLDALGQLWLRGLDVDWPAFYAAEHRRRVELPTYPFERKRHWITPAAPAAPSLAPPREGHGTRIPMETTMLSTSTSLQELGIHRTPRHREIVKHLCQTINEITGVDPDGLDLDVPFTEMGVNSLIIIQFAQAIQDRFGVRVLFSELLEEIRTFHGLAKHLDRELPADSPLFPPEAPATSSAAARSEVVPSTPAPTAPTPIVPAPGPYPEEGGAVVSVSDRERLFNQQLLLVQEHQKMLSDVLNRQLSVLGGNGQGTVSATGTAAGAPVAAVSAPIPRRSAEPPAGVALPPRPTESGKPRSGGLSQSIDPEVFVPYKPTDVATPGHLTEQQQEYLESFVERFTMRTARSKEIAATYRSTLADNRQCATFRKMWKELVYQIVVERSDGIRIWDADGNEYVDMTIGYGILFFGHNPPFIQDAIKEQVDRGLHIGPHTETAGEVSRLFCKLSGQERVVFCNSGTEAVVAALRIARTVTRRDKVAIFTGAYHGWHDVTAARGMKRDGRLFSLPMIPGVPPTAVEDTLSLHWDSQESLEILRANCHDLAAVMVEPVQSRRPDIQPREFLRELRRITEKANTALIFDEMITGFRVHPQGAQAVFGVRADIATYGKFIGGGLPIGAIAGKAAYMDAFDGGAWQFGDDSYPRAEKTYFAGAFFKNPVTMAAALAVLRRLEEEGEGLQEELNRRTDEFVAATNRFLEENAYPMRMVNFGSIFRLLYPEGWDVQFQLVIFHLHLKGVFAWEGGTFFLSTAHREADLEHFAQALRESFTELRLGGFFPEA